MYMRYKRANRKFLGRTFILRRNAGRFMRLTLIILCSMLCFLMLPSLTPLFRFLTRTDLLMLSISSAFPVTISEQAALPFPNEYDILNSVIPSIRSNKVMAKKYAAQWDMSIRAKRSDNHSGSSSSDTKTIQNMRIQTIDMSSGGITFNNASGYSIDANTLLENPLVFGSKKDEPRVLIVHTHTSEAYFDSPGARSRDDKENVVRVGKEIADRLNKAGIVTIHDTTKNDEPDYNGSYKKALSVIQQNLLRYPSIEIVLDIHRDYTVRDSGTENELHLKPTQTQNGKDAAQIMFVVGTDAMDLYHPDWQHNLSFAVKLQNKMNEIHPNLCRPINVRTERFNQHMTKGSMIIEVGSSTNTLEEAVRSGEYIAEAVACVLSDK